MKVSEPPIVIEQILHHPAESVWQALTDVTRMRRWYFDNIPDFKPEVGFETRFDVTSGERVFPHIWKVSKVEPLRRIEYEWHYDGYPGDSLVVFELVRQANATLLRLTHRVREDFPDDIPEFRRESGLQGWNYLLRESLTRFLEGKSADDDKR